MEQKKNYVYNFGFKRNVSFSTTPKPNNLGEVNWREVTNYLSSVSDIRKHLCFGCPSHKLYDKNNKAYKIERKHSLDEVKAIVEEIRKINAQ